MKTFVIIAALTAWLGFGSAARAQAPLDVGIEAGAGYASFVDGNVADVTRGGVGWDVRLLLGAHSILGLEAAYVGTDNAVQGVSNVSLRSNAFEGDLRLSTPGWFRTPVQLFAFAGGGVNRFSLVYAGPNLTAIHDADTTFVAPLGAGLQFNLNPHVTLDTRFTYRFMFDNDLTERRDNADMYTITARLGLIL
jgi:opacity protein-like surface antigen